MFRNINSNYEFFVNMRKLIRITKICEKNRIEKNFLKIRLKYFKIIIFFLTMKSFTFLKLKV
jgi:hypothetical protein